ncbi:MAG TPA: IPTL-CTERM sorting domain-containing protein [Thermoanaerobaculia bacterium]
MKTSMRSLSLSIIIFILLSGSVALSAQPTLGTAADFGVLAGSTVTNTGASSVDGDVGVSPGSAIVGFPPGTLTGTMHANDAVAIQAQSDLTTAYNEVAGTACTANLSGSDLGGMTLTPGVYCFDSSAQLTGTLTLDALGDPNAVFLFKIGSTLTTASNSTVLLQGSASGCNVFWQVGSSATLGTTSRVEGNILALTSITLNTGATVSGRVLARNGAVTLDTATIVDCASGCGPITLDPATLPAGVVDTPYNQTITATGGTSPYEFEIVDGFLPTGLSLSLTGDITGTPTATGSFTFTVRATDDVGCVGTRIYTIVINPVVIGGCPTITVSPETLPLMVPGTPFSQMIEADGGEEPYVFTHTAGTLPPGLSLASDGLLDGTPTTPGSYTFTVTATDEDGCIGTRIYTALVDCPTIAIAPMVLPALQVGAPYSQLLIASGGTSPYVFLLTGGVLPAGLTLSSDGLISGTPTTEGSFTFTVTATDANSCAVSRTYTGGVAVAIPTLAEWMLILLAGFLAIIGLVTLRR